MIYIDKYIYVCGKCSQESESFNLQSISAGGNISNRHMADHYNADIVGHCINLKCHETNYIYMNLDGKIIRRGDKLSRFT